MERGDMSKEQQVPVGAEDSAGGGGQRRHRPLDSLERVRRELARVYWQQVDGALQMDIAKGRAYLLGQLVTVLKAEQADEAEIERRLAELERRLAQGVGNG